MIHMKLCVYIYVRVCMFACILNLHSTDEMRKSDLVRAQQEFKSWSSKTDSSALCSTLGCTQMVIEISRAEEKKNTE